jgi:hypothetical protein
MSTVINTLSGGASTSSSSGVIFMNSTVLNGIDDEFVSNGAASYGSGLYSYASVAGKASSVQYAYLRLGPIDLTDVKTVGADISVVTSSGTTRSVLFVSKGANDRSWTSGVITSIGSASNANTTHALRTLDVSGLSGEYYIYAGTDSNNSSWSNARTARIYSVVAVKE